MLEEAGEEILSAVITDIIVTYGMDVPLKGYYQITHTSNGTEVDTIKFMSPGGYLFGWGEEGFKFLS